ncbi:hypothetical protein QQF64_003229 [Cirrhinus molitorella]|uniref:Uncharacterized protein n=1 Tax=Cirrhinus molitorella TaxID=172907 RepID=A0ABR3MJG7_9TELE
MGMNSRSGAAAAALKRGSVLESGLLSVLMMMIKCVFVLCQHILYFVTINSPETSSCQDTSWTMPSHFRKYMFAALKIFEGMQPKIAASWGSGLVCFWSIVHGSLNLFPVFKYGKRGITTV